jgi:hypothetical protein
MSYKDYSLWESEYFKAHCAGNMYESWQRAEEFAVSCVEAEPEYPGELPEGLSGMLHYAIESKDIDLIVDALRATVRLTKAGIISRIRGEV